MIHSNHTENAVRQRQETPAAYFPTPRQCTAAERIESSGWVQEHTITADTQNLLS